MPRKLAGTVLEGIVGARMHEITGARQKYPAAAMEAVLDRAPEIRSFRRALELRDGAVIAELKKASPSAGVLRSDFRPVEIALELEKAGAAALSVVTEPRYFQGGLETLAAVRWRAGLPLLRKDFIVDPYQVLEARHAGADAVLLIAALLEGPLLGALRAEVERLGMDALIEVHDEEELERALQAGATLIGVNSRDLRTFHVSIESSLELARRLPKGIVAVAESGLRSADDVRRLRDAGYRAFLIGEQLMRAPSPGAALARLVPRAVSGPRRIS